MDGGAYWRKIRSNGQHVIFPPAGLHSYCTIEKRVQGSSFFVEAFEGADIVDVFYTSGERRKFLQSKVARGSTSKTDTLLVSLRLIRARQLPLVALHAMQSYIHVHRNFSSRSADLEPAKVASHRLGTPSTGRLT